MTTSKDRLVTRLTSQQARVAIVGLGYVGLPLAVAFAEVGFDVTGIDLDSRKIDAVNRGESYIADVPSDTVKRLVSAGKLDAATDYGAVEGCDAVSICVPTPLNKTGDPDISSIVAAAHEIARCLHPGMVVVLESTTYPGTTREVVLPILAETGLEIGCDVFLAFSPERVDPGREDWTTVNTPRVMGGTSPACLEVACTFYQQAMETIVPVSSTDAAEMAKLLENTFRAINIGLANEILMICDTLGLDAWEVIDAAATKPFGYMKFTPGPGIGGHCIPVDPLYLSWRLKRSRFQARFIELAAQINTAMPAYWVGKVQDTLNDAGRSVNGSRVLVLGVSYKRDIDDVRESPAFDIIALLREKGARVTYHDPYVAAVHFNEIEMAGVPDLKRALRESDCAILVTDHSAYTPAALSEAALLVDTRHTGATRSPTR